MSVWIHNRDVTAPLTVETYKELEVDKFIESLEAIVGDLDQDAPQLPSIPDIRFLATVAINPEAVYSTLGREYAVRDQCASTRALNLLKRLHLLTRDKTHLHTVFCSAFTVQVTTDIRRRATKNQDSFHSGGDSFTELNSSQSAAKDEEFDLDDMLKSMERDGNFDFDVGMDDADTTRSDDEETQAPVPAYETDMREFNLFRSCGSIWHMVGWAFVCSTVGQREYSERWDQWEPFLEFLLDLLEHNLDASIQDCVLIKQWLEHLSMADVIQAILATMTFDEHGQISIPFKHVLRNEKVPKPKELSRMESPKVEARFDFKASVLRSRFLDLIIKADTQEDHMRNIREQCRTVLQNDNTHHMLVSPSGNRQVAGFARPHTLSRLVWSSHLEEPLCFEYLRLNISDDTVAGILKSVPARYYSHQDREEAAKGILVCIYDAMVIWMRQWNRTELVNARKKIKHAFYYGQQERGKWYERRKLAHSEPIAQLEKNIEVLLQVAKVIG